MQKVNKNTFKKILRNNTYTVRGNVREDEACYSNDYNGEKAKQEMLNLLKYSFVTLEAEKQYCVQSSFFCFYVTIN